jgi:virulence factor Mce-like protein
MTRRGTAALAGSPALVGALTVLTALIAVFIAYNANSGLPFVPTYKLKAELPSGGKLVRGSEVRVGGFRVGLVERISTRAAARPGQRAAAVIEMKLDKRVAPLARDTRLTVRPRSTLGLKYVELRPGRSAKSYPAGATIAHRGSGERLEFEDVYSTFDAETRPAVQGAIQGVGDGLAGRGASLNPALASLRELLGHLRPTMASLADADSELGHLFPRLARLTGELAPVAEAQAELFASMGTTFEALSRHETALRESIERSPRTLEAAISSFRVSRPFLAELTELSANLRPAAGELSRSVPAITTALVAGRAPLRGLPPFGDRLHDLSSRLARTLQNPNTLLALRDLRTTLAVARPAVEYLAPYQTVCNYPLAFANQLGRHFAAPARAGTAERVLLKQANNPGQVNQLGTTESSGPADIPADQDPQTAENAFGKLHVLHGQAYSPAVDAQGNADCQAGQFGYLDRLVSDTPPLRPDQPGDKHVVADPNTPGLAGPTFKGRELGIWNLGDVP